MLVSIRPLNLCDANKSWKWRNNPSVWKYTRSNPDQLITKEIELEWLKKALLNNTECRFAICVGKEMNYIGNIQLTDITKKSAQFHIFIGERKFHGLGIGTQATKLMIDHAFNTLGLRSIYLFVSVKNIYALKLYYSFGFKVIEVKASFFKMILENK